MDDLVEFLRARLDEDEGDAREAGEVGGGVHGYQWHVSGSRADEGGTYWSLAAIAKTGDDEQVIEVVGSGMSGGGAHTEQVAHHAARYDPARVLREVEAKRRILAAHEPEWTTVEWPDDQTGKGEGAVCRSCGNKDIDGWINWRPAVGEAGIFPPGVKPPYIVAPCDTLRLLALPYAAHPGYRPEWAPSA